MAAWIKQGDAYSFPVAVGLNGETVSKDDVSVVEFYIGGVRKVYPIDVTFSDEDKCFYVPLTQEETFGFEANSAVAVDMRIKFKGGDVIGAKNMEYITVYDAVSEEEI
jgi:hypothetical protein